MSAMTTMVDRYAELDDEFPLYPISDDEGHQAAKRRFRSLGSQDDAGAVEYKAALVHLIARYERRMGLQLDLSKLTPARIVLHLLEQRGLSVNAFSKQIKVAQSGLAAMLSGKRAWSKAVAIKVADGLGLGLEVLIRQQK